MKLSRKNFRLLPKALAASACAAAISFSAGDMLAQNTVSYGTNFDNLQSNQSLSGTDNWTSTDANSSDYIGVISGYSTSADVGTTGFGGDHWAEVGGVFQPGVVPSTPLVYLSHATPGATTSFVFNVDFGVSSSQTPYSTQDSFGFSLRDALGNSLLSINFDQTADTSTDAARFRIGTGLEMNPNQTGILLNNKYHLNVSVNVSANTFSASLLSSLAGSQPVTIANNVSLGAVNASLIAQTGATWTLANPSSPGSNALIFDNFVATVPEPSTYAMLGLGASLAFLAVRRRMRA